MPYGLKEIELAKLNEVFAANERIERVVLYGSRAKGNYKPFSDVDITLEGAELTHTDLNRISLAIDDLLLPYQFDISIFHTLKNEALIDHIRRMGITVYEKKSEWKEYKLGEIAKFSQGLQVPVENQYDIYADNRIRFIRIVDITQNQPTNIRYIDMPDKRYIIRKGDLVMIRYGYPGTVADCFEGVIANNLFKIAPIIDNLYINKYLYYYLKQKIVLEYFNSTQNSSTMPAITFSQVSDLELFLPPLDEQKRIASILSSLDDKIDLLYRENASLEQMAETLFKELVLNKENEGTLEQIISIQNGYAFKSKDFKDVGTHKVIKIKNISDSIVNIDTTDFIDDNAIMGLSPKFKIYGGDILIAMTGAEIGKLGIIPQNDKSLWLNQRVGLLVEKLKGSKYLAYLQLKSDFGQDYIENTATGSAQPNISGIGIEKCGFPLFKQEDLIQISLQIGELYDKIIFNLGQINLLKDTRDFLLPKLMSNEIKLI